jgi:hypothetical protein
MPGPTRCFASNAERQRAYRDRCAEARRRELEAKGMPPLPPLPNLPGHVRWRALIRHAERLLQGAADEMEDYYDARSVAWQESERGDTFLEQLQALREAHSTVADLRDA